MKKILISIKPEHVRNILSGIKKFEYRTKVAKDDVKSLIIYSTFPEKKVVAEATIKRILKYKPSKLWKITHKNSGISKAYFDLYFKDREIAYAYELGEIKIFPETYSLIDFGVKFAPQSFIYIQ